MWAKCVCLVMLMVLISSTEHSYIHNKNQKVDFFWLTEVIFSVSQVNKQNLINS